MFSKIGLWELILILCIFVLLFGASRLTRTMSDIGKGIKKFKTSLENKDKQKKK